MVVGSEAVSFARLVSPPPDTVTVFVPEDALFATETTRKISGYGVLNVRVSDRVQVTVAISQVHPVPLMDVAVRPGGSLSTTVTGAVVDPVPTLVAMMSYVPVKPCRKLPACDSNTAISGEGGGRMVVGSCATLFPVFVSPPPETVAVLTTVDAAFKATSTVRVIGGYAAGEAPSESARVQVRFARTQLHPVPLIAVAVSPLGRTSTTVTVPLLARFPMLATVIVYVAPVSPWKKLPKIGPWCVLLTMRSGLGAGSIVVGSEALSFAVFVSPPPETLTVLMTEVAALISTFTTRVIGG